jgi:hypothetical protein
VRKLKPLMSAIWMLGSATCIAAPFCVVTTSGAQDCSYSNETACTHAAAVQRGTCFVNTGLSLRSTNHQDSRYCLVLKGGVQQCSYPDMNACARAGLDTGGMCMESSRLEH